MAFDLQGHRGARGLAPENTLVAFDKALNIGVNTLELDVGVTADGVVVIGHDPLLNADLTRDASGKWLRQLGMDAGPAINTLSYAQLQQYDVGRIEPSSRYGQTFASQTPADGARMPRLADLFERVNAMPNAGHIRFNIETKLHPAKPSETLAPEAFAQALLAVVNAHGMQGRVSIQSFDWRTLAVVAKAGPKIPLVYLTVRSPNSNNLADGTWTTGWKLADFAHAPAMVAHAAKQMGTQAKATWSPNAADLTADLVKAAQGLGLLVVPWTVNDPALMAKLMDWQVDGIISDYPDRLREAMAAKGVRLPQTLGR